MNAYTLSLQLPFRFRKIRGLERKSLLTGHKPETKNYLLAL